MPDIVAIEHIAVHRATEKFSFERLRNRGLPRAGQASEPDDRAPVSIVQSSAARGDFAFGPENILALNSRAIGIDAPENNSAAADPAVLNQDEPAERGNPLMVIEHQGSAGLQSDSPDLIARDVITLPRRDFERRGIHHLIDPHYLTLHLLRPDADRIGSALLQRLFRHPENIRVEAVRLDWSFRLVRGHMTSFYEDLFTQRDPDGVTGNRLVTRRPIPRFDRGDDGRFICRRKNQLIADAQRTALDPPGNNAPLVKPINILDGEPEWLIQRAVTADNWSRDSKIVPP